MTIDEMIQNEPYKSCFEYGLEKGHEQGGADKLDKVIALVKSDGFKMRCIISKEPFFDFVEKEFWQLKEKK